MASLYNLQGQISNLISGIGQSRQIVFSLFQGQTEDRVRFYNHVDTPTNSYSGEEDQATMKLRMANSPPNSPQLGPGLQRKQRKV